MFSIDIHKLLQQFVYNPEEPMIFNSGFFLFLFTAFLFVYIPLSKTYRAKVIFLTIFSFYFYYKSSGLYFVLLLTTVLIDYTLALSIYKTKIYWQRLTLLVISLTTNLGMLGYFKYTNFFHELFSLAAGTSYEPFDIFLPVGISFFTFQSLSYTIDVFRGNLKPVDHVIDFAFFVSFFPQLVAGPIVRASDFIPQIQKPTFVTHEMFGRGVFLIATGLFKKAIISNYISLNFVDRVFDSPTLYTGLENLFAVYGYALQIYCDFSGYSDMAIGLALLLGFHFNINFDSPYQSLNITEFWRRWHISLSTWLKDYLYISLGGNRKGKFRTYVNLLITMLLGGFWHGASVRFILWGAMHGAALALHKYFNSLTLTKILDKRWVKLSNILGWFITFHFVCFCWIFFRATSMDVAGSMIEQIFTNFSLSILPEFIWGYRFVVGLMLLGYGLHFVPKQEELLVQKTVIEMPRFAQAAIIATIILLVIQTKSSAIQPFIYFQF